jgi:hypothetical protein
MHWHVSHKVGYVFCFCWREADVVRPPPSIPGRIHKAAGRKVHSLQGLVEHRNCTNYCVVVVSRPLLLLCVFNVIVLLLLQASITILGARRFVRRRGHEVALDAGALMYVLAEINI